MLRNSESEALKSRLYCHSMYYIFVVLLAMLGAWPRIGEIQAIETPILQYALGIMQY